MNRFLPHNGCRKKRARSKMTVRVAPYVHGPSREEAMFARRQSRAWKRPLLFVVAAITTASVVFTLVKAADPASKLPIAPLIALEVGLFLSVLFTHVRRPLARGRAMTTPRQPCRGTPAFRLRTGPGSRVERLLAAHAAGTPFPVERVAPADLKAGDVIVVVAGEVMPADGEVIVGGDRCRLTAGTRVISSFVVVRVAARGKPSLR